MLFPSKINTNKIQDILSEAKVKFPTRRLVILYDKSNPTYTFGFDCCSTPLENFAKEDFNNTIYIYACDQDDIGSPFIETIINNKGMFLPVEEGKPSLYVNTNSPAREVLEQEYEHQVKEQFSKWDFGAGDFINLTQAIEITSKLEGSFLEIGCYRGSSGCVALHYMERIGLQRDCYFLDVFEGFTYEEATSSADVIWKNTHKTEGIDIISKRLKQYENLKLKVFIKKCNIINNFPTEINQICVANIDVDMYEAVYSSLIKTAPLIVKSGIMIVEDPGHTPYLIGARVALNRFLTTSIAKEFIPIYMESGQTFLIRK